VLIVFLFYAARNEKKRSVVKNISCRLEFYENNHFHMSYFRSYGFILKANLSKFLPINCMLIRDSTLI